MLIRIIFIMQRYIILFSLMVQQGYGVLMVKIRYKILIVGVLLVMMDPEHVFRNVTLQEYNVSSDATAEGTLSVDGANNYDDYFVMTDFDNMDLHLKAPSEVIWGTNGTFDFTGTYVAFDDIDGNNRFNFSTRCWSR